MIFIANIACSYYFEKRRAFATGLAISGSGVGVAILPIVSSYLLINHGWQWVFFMFGGNIFFHGFFPAKFTENLILLYLPSVQTRVYDFL